MRTTPSLTGSQADLVLATEPAQLADLTEDELIELHQKVRRARDKQVNLYRRSASARVATKAGRGAPRPANRLFAERAEVFELALARVSTRLGVVARAAAAALRAERLAAAREGRGGAGAVARPGSVASLSVVAPVPSSLRAPETSRQTAIDGSY